MSHNPTPTALTADKVRAEMARARVPQVVVASHLRLSQAAVSRRLRGLTPFDINELSAVAELLGVRITDLLPADEPAAVSA